MGLDFFINTTWTLFILYCYHLTTQFLTMSSPTENPAAVSLTESPSLSSRSADVQDEYSLYLQLHHSCL